MKKQEFITRLQYKLSGVPLSDVLGRLDFISEVIDDKIEDGLTEDEAVAAMGSPDDVAAGIIKEVGSSGDGEATPTEDSARCKRTPSALIITLIALGSPIWISLAAAAFSLTASAYALIWSLAGSLWAIFGTLIGVGVGGFFMGCVFVFVGNVAAGFALIGASLLCTGLSLPAFYGCLYATKGAAWISKQIAVKIKGLL